MPDPIPANRSPTIRKNSYTTSADLTEVIYQHASVKVDTERFKRDAVAMLEASPDASMRIVAEELGINRSTLGYWYK